MLSRISKWWFRYWRKLRTFLMVFLFSNRTGRGLMALRIQWNSLIRMASRYLRIIQLSPVSSTSWKRCGRGWSLWSDLRWGTTKIRSRRLWSMHGRMLDKNQLMNLFCIYQEFVESVLKRVVDTFKNDVTFRFYIICINTKYHFHFISNYYL